jgi:hypothetical protein
MGLFAPLLTIDSSDGVEKNREGEMSSVLFLK